MKRAFACLLALTAPLLAWDEEDGFDSFKKPSLNRQSSLTDNVYTKKADESFANQQRNSVKLESIQEANARRNREMDEFTARSQRTYEEQRQRSEKAFEKQEAENNAWEAERWRDVETVAGAFVASGPYYKGGQANVITDKGLVYSTGRGSVVAPDGYYYRTGNLWVGPNGKLAGQSGSGNNSYIWGSDGGTAIGAGRGYFTERGYSWPAYPDQSSYGVSRTMRKP